ncbi:MAG: glutamate--tRNA ligase, partial [Clostridia bacterium]|nr:glutamate--tRNA ligase [Clostridia bacterium]
FDLDKLNDISKNVISRMNADEVYENTLAWANENDADYAAILAADPAYAKSIFAIGRGGNKPRKDLTLWKDTKDYVSFFYDSLFAPEYTLPAAVSADDAKAICQQFAAGYDEADEQTVWFDKMKQIAANLGYAPETKLFKKNPESYKGHVGDISMVLRVAVTGRQNSPDLYEVMKILGKDRVVARLNAMIER